MKCNSAFTRIMSLERGKKNNRLALFAQHYRYRGCSSKLYCASHAIWGADSLLMQDNVCLHVTWWMLKFSVEVKTARLEWSLCSAITWISSNESWSVWYLCKQNMKFFLFVSSIYECFHSICLEEGMIEEY